MIAGWDSHPPENTAFSQRTLKPVIEPTKVAAGSRHARWLKFGRIDRLEGAILGVSVEISQISGSPGLDGVVNLFLYLVE